MRRERREFFPDQAGKGSLISSYEVETGLLWMWAFFCDSEDEVNENALRILEEDRYDLITVYNGNFDATMHRYGPESAEALAQLDHNAAAYEKLCQKACEVWKGKNHLEAFLPDHGCHAIDGDLGAHGLDMPEDMNIIHFYSLHKN